MFKFLRKYSVWILGFGGTLLLIAFLAPNVIQQLAQQAGYSGTVQATVGDGEIISFDQWQQNQLEAQVIDRIGGVIPGVGPVESPSHWFLLTREADLAGLTPPIQSVAMDSITLNNYSSRTGANPRIVLEAIAHFQGVQRLVQMYQTAGRFSDRRLQKAADDYFSSAAVETIVIPSFPEDNGSFTNEAMETQMSEWADVPPGSGDYGFGYQLPNRFKVEWLSIPSSSITTATEQSEEFSSRAQRKFWRRNENDPRFPEIGSTSDIPEEVKTAYLEQLTAKKRSEITRSATEHLRNPRRGIEESNGFLVLPEDWDSKKLSLEVLATTLQEEFAIALPAYGASAEWTSTDTASETPFLGELVIVNQGNTPTNFQTLVSTTKEFDPNGLFRIQEAVTSPVLETSKGDLVLFRLTATDAAREPNRLDEVKEQVTYDLGRIARWGTLKAEADLIEQFARENGMLATAIKYGEEVNFPRPVSMVETEIPTFYGPADRRPLMVNSITQQIANGFQLSDMATPIPSLQKNDRELIQSIVERANALPLDVPVASLPIEDRIFIVQSPDNMSLVIVRLTGTSPASSELATDFSGGTSAILQTLISLDELGGFTSISDTFSFDALTQRHNFERPRTTAQIDDSEIDPEVN